MTHPPQDHRRDWNWHKTQAEGARAKLALSNGAAEARSRDGATVQETKDERTELGTSQSGQWSSASEGQADVGFPEPLRDLAPLPPV